MITIDRNPQSRSTGLGDHLRPDYSGQNDVYRLQTMTARDGVDFNLAYIGRDFTLEHTEDFVPTYMRALFEFGRAQIKKGTAWKKSSPFLIPDQPQAGKPGE